MNFYPAFPFDGKRKCLEHSDPETIIKVGEGTYGEAFQAGNAVCKIVPVDGDLKVNGEVQKVFSWPHDLKYPHLLEVEIANDIGRVYVPATWWLHLYFIGCLSPFLSMIISIQLN